MPISVNGIFQDPLNDALYDIYRLKRINLPEKLKCSRCGKIKGQSSYSKKQLATLKSNIALKKKVNFHTGCVTCAECTGQQVFELKCVLCDRTKGLESFSKAQRKDPKTAQCYNCLQGILDTNPVEETGLTLDDASTTLGSQAPYEMGAASSSRYTGDYSEDSDEEDEVVRKGWIEPKRASTRATNSTANGTTAISAASTAKNGSGGKNTPTQTSSKSAGVSLSGTPVNPGWAAYGVTPASTYASSVTASEKASGKFAKVKDQGPRFSKQNAPRMQAPATEGATIDSESESDSEDPNDYL
ncbi:hypothetical protein AAP_01656 [Ascosphaera apis ARSEF 7405]|uniref:Stc1 domain-containing protein n=1 Tax=Ascosphaera apis ARSEF 7405 TaxID=392613 RepID=A0A168BDQ7_9EURO|nr:hypothetical protein AAP_01656 [Ascosphaera apis ARSEF 7405]